ncbi:MAG: hypothetical protein IPL26_00175 [Leptospiraceae bacterium]|nr:hypothetical protein [Leptospiraceae bacterium]
MEFLTWENIWLILKILSVPTVLKLYLWFQSLRMYGVYNIFASRERIFKHEIFDTLDRLYTDEELFNKIPDIARKEIFKDIFKLEVYSLNDILLYFRNYIFLHESFFKFMQYHRYLDSSALVELFLKLYNAHRDKMELAIRKKLIRGGLDKNIIIFITQKYYEFTAQNSYLLRGKLEILKTRKNLFFTIMDILDLLKIEIESQKIFLPLKFMSLNGKLDGIVYKTYQSETRTKIKVYEEVKS